MVRLDGRTRSERSVNDVRALVAVGDSDPVVVGVEVLLGLVLGVALPDLEGSVVRLGRSRVKAEILGAV